MLSNVWRRPLGYSADVPGDTGPTLKLIGRILFWLEGKTSFLRLKASDVGNTQLTFTEQYAGCAAEAIAWDMSF